MELAFAALHQLCASMLDRLLFLPEPQRDALGTVFGIRAGPAPDRFLVGLAVLSLLAETADERPLVCLIDDAQWLDRASAQTLALAARRLFAESVAVVFAMRESDTDVEPLGLPELVIDGLEKNAAHALLHSVTPALLDQRVRDRIVAETRGNPLAILELSRAVVCGARKRTRAAGRSWPRDRIESSFARRVALLPPDTRLCCWSRPPSRWEKRGWSGVQLKGWAGIEAAAPAHCRRPVRPGAACVFVIRWCAQPFTVPPGRGSADRAWCIGRGNRSGVRAGADRVAPGQAATQPDEELAAELERSAERAQARGGFAQAQVSPAAGDRDDT
jgi:hypothetical protein